MPFVQPTSWEKHLFDKWEPLTKNVNIPLYDEAAWTWMPELRPLLNRLTVALWCDYPCGPHGVLPEQYPILSKPVYNLYGSGVGVCTYGTQEQYLNNYTPGHFWMPVFSGEQLSTDILVYHREVISTITARGTRSSKEVYKFDAWELLDETPQPVKQTIRKFVAQHVPLGYCGALNIETVGGNIIEVGARFSTQFCQFYPDEWFRVMCCLYQHGSLLPISIPKHITGWSFPIWWWVIPHDWQMLKHPKIYDTRTDCVNNSLAQKRIAIINTETHEEGTQLRELMCKHLAVDIP